MGSKRCLFWDLSDFLLSLKQANSLLECSEAEKFSLVQPIKRVWLISSIEWQKDEAVYLNELVLTLVLNILDELNSVCVFLTALQVITATTETTTTTSALISRIRAYRFNNRPRGANERIHN